MITDLLQHVCARKELYPEVNRAVHNTHMLQSLEKRFGIVAYWDPHVHQCLLFALKHHMDSYGVSKRCKLNCLYNK